MWQNKSYIKGFVIYCKSIEWVGFRKPNMSCVLHVPALTQKVEKVTVMEELDHPNVSDLTAQRVPKFKP